MKASSSISGGRRHRKSRLYAAASDWERPGRDGTKVSVWVSDYNAPLGTGTVSGCEYSAKVFKYGGAFAGKTLIFKIADKDTGTTAMWESGMATVLDLAID